MATLEKIGADGAGCQSHGAVDQQFVQALHSARKDVCIWTVEDVALAKLFAQLGAEAITSNRAGWLKQQIRGKAEKAGEPNQAP